MEPSPLSERSTADLGQSSAAEQAEEGEAASEVPEALAETADSEGEQAG